MGLVPVSWYCKNKFMRLASCLVSECRKSGNVPESRISCERTVFLLMSELYYFLRGKCKKRGRKNGNMNRKWDS